MFPKVHVNGEAMTGRDWLFAAGAVAVIIGLCLAGVPWALIGFGIAAMAVSRLKWVSSTDSPSSAPPAQPTAPSEST